MHMVHHFILSSCGSLETKWDESRSELQNWDFHSNLLSSLCVEVQIGKTIMFQNQ
jgi:hypothetical protein